MDGHKIKFGDELKITYISRWKTNDGLLWRICSLFLLQTSFCAKESVIVALQVALRENVSL